MQPPNLIFILSLLMATAQLSIAQSAQGPILKRQVADVQSSAAIVGADGETPRWKSRAQFETPAEQENDFTKSLNTLLAALHDFSATYHSGHVIDVKKVKAVRKAWEELEKSGWFRSEKPK